jgi:hypothetical protein
MTGGRELFLSPTETTGIVGTSIGNVFVFMPKDGSGLSFVEGFYSKLAPLARYIDVAAKQIQATTSATSPSFHRRVGACHMW